MTVAFAPDRRDPRAERSRAALRAAMIALLGEMPLEQVTAVALTARAGVGYATFARQYSGIDALLTEISQELIAMLAARLSASSDPDATARDIVAFVAEHRLVMRTLLVSASTAVRRDVVANAGLSARAAGSPRDATLPEGLAIAHVTGASITILTWWLRDAPDSPPAQVATLLRRLVFAPVAVPAGV